MIDAEFRIFVSKYRHSEQVRVTFPPGVLSTMVVYKYRSSGDLATWATLNRRAGS